MDTELMTADTDRLHAFLAAAERDASARAGDPFDRTALSSAFAEAELIVIANLRELVATDPDVRAFVGRWRDRVENASPEDYPQRRGAALSKSDDGVTWTVGAQRLGAAVTLFDAFVADPVITAYRVLGTVTEG